VAQQKRILAVFIEPTPYILGFLKALVSQYPGEIDVFFLKENHTQQWEVGLPEAYTVLSMPLIQSVTYFNQQITQKNYQLIHLAGWGNLTCLAMMLLSRFKKIPLSIESDTQLNKTIPKWKQRMKYWGYQRALYPVLFKFPSVFLPGGTRQKKYLEHYKVAKEKIVLAQMTVDITALKENIARIQPEERLTFRQAHHAEDSDIIFLYVGRLLDWKGVIELVEAFKQMNHSRAKLWIAGEGALEDYVKKNSDVLDNMFYFGRVEGSRLMNIYHAADVFVLPSLAEPWGLVVNEAMASGKAVIISEDAGCVDDLVFHGETGLLIPPKDIQALISAMTCLASDDECREQLASQAQKHIATWTLENEANNVMCAWKQVLL
ncbi:MAG: glycosyltransferase family 4 protein, partial [Legionella sp.]|nr:glycosyltransferase family 4 protein [Legionella sp.]